MRTELHLESSPVIGRTIIKLAFLGGLALGMVYLVFSVVENAVSIIP